jgi:hypothetical protein
VTPRLNPSVSSARDERPEPPPPARTEAVPPPLVGPSTAVATRAKALSAPSQPPPSAVNQDADRQAILDILGKFAAAHTEKSTSALKAIAPFLTVDELNALDRAFLDAGSYTMKLSDVQIQVRGDQAIANCAVSRRIVFHVGTAREVNSRTEFDFAKQSGVWSILAIH